MVVRKVLREKLKGALATKRLICHGCRVEDGCFLYLKFVIIIKYIIIFPQVKNHRWGSHAASYRSQAYVCF